jgi:hypothetical protein
MTDYNFGGNLTVVDINKYASNSEFHTPSSEHLSTELTKT